MAKSNTAHIKLGEKVYKYILTLKERLNNKWEEKLCDVIIIIE